MRRAKLKIKPPPLEIPPIVFLGIACTLGTLAGSMCANHNPATGVSIAISASVMSTCVYAKKYFFILLTIATAGLYFARYSYHAQSAVPQWATVHHGDFLELQGVISSDPKTARRIIGLMSAIDDRQPITTFDVVARPTIKPEVFNGVKSTTLRVHVNGIANVHKGDQISTVGRIRLNMNRKDVFPRLYISSPELIVVQKNGISLQGIIEQVIKERITKGITGKEKTLVRAVFFGDRGDNYKEVSATFRLSGLSHILAISGLHIAIIVVTVLWLLRSASLGRLVVFGSMCAVSITLILIIEERPPVIRAVFMVIIFSALQLRGQRPRGIGVLSSVVLILLWSDPAIIHTTGFVLSFSVVSGLCLLFPTLQWKLVGPIDVCATIVETARHKLSVLWTVGFCAIIVVTPITLHLFGTAAPSGTLSSLGGVLLLFVLLSAGITRLFVGWVHPHADDALVWMIQNTATAMIDAANLYGDLPFAFLTLPKISSVWTCVMLLVVSVTVLSVGSRGRKWRFLLLAIVVSCPLALRRTRGTTITTLRVGHGTCHIIQDSTETIIVDAGSRANLDVGQNTIVPMLQHLGVGTIASIIVTHNDLDHCSGVLELMDAYCIEEILMTPYSLRHPTKLVKMILIKAKNKNISINTITKGWEASTEHAVIQALWPRENVLYHSSNESSAVVQIETFGRRILLTGDINEQTITTILESGIQKADVLELPHHGQWSEESMMLVKRLQPIIVIQSTSPERYARDKWKIPSCSDRFVTCVDGTITTAIGNSGEIVVETSYTNYAIHYLEDSSIN